MPESLIQDVGVTNIWWYLRPQTGDIDPLFSYLPTNSFTLCYLGWPERSNDARITAFRSSAT